MGCRNNSCRCNTVPLRFNGENIDCLGVLKGDTFESVIRKVSDFVCNISFQDGEDGVDGQDGQSIDHVSFTSSDGGDEPGLPGAVDTYTVWGDVDETVNLGTFTVYNGTNSPEEGDTVFHKTVNIGPWDMDASNSVSVAHGLDFTKIVSIDVHIFNNDADALFSLAAGNPGPGSDPAGAWFAGTLNINLFRTAGGYFDSLDFNDAVMNRGRILIHYIP